MTRHRPPKRRMLMRSFMACMTAPAERNSAALKKPWPSRWMMPIAYTALAEADGEEHVADLADRRVREHPFQVVLPEGADASVEQGDRADDRHNGAADCESLKIGADRAIR